jgi:hypothetical protein
MKSRNIQISLVVMCSIIAGVFLFQGHGLVVGRDEKQEDKNLELGIWSSEMTFEQTFIASQNNLCRIDFFVDSYRPWESPYLDLRLFEIPTAEKPRNLSYEVIRNISKEIRYKRLNGWLLSYHMFNDFSFAPIADSQNKRYLLSIQSPGLKKGSTSSILLASPRERYEDGNLFVNGEKQKGDLTFRALYEQPRIQVIRQSVTSLALQKPYPFSKPVAYYVLFIGYMIVLIVFFFQILRGFEG